MLTMFKSLEQASHETLSLLQTEELTNFIKQKQLLASQIKYRELFLITRKMNKFKVFSSQDRGLSSGGRAGINCAHSSASQRNTKTGGTAPCPLENSHSSSQEHHQV